MTTRSPTILLSGWSYGGLVARTAAAQPPDQVAGMVLTAATSPRATGLGEPLNGANGIADTDTIVSTVGEGPDLGNRPVTVVQRGQPDNSTTADWEETWTDTQLQAATVSGNSLHTVDDADHSTPIGNPGDVVAATAVAGSIRTRNAALPTRPDDLIAAGVTRTGG